MASYSTKANQTLTDETITKRKKRPATASIGRFSLRNKSLRTCHPSKTIVNHSLRGKIVEEKSLFVNPNQFESNNDRIQLVETQSGSSSTNITNSTLTNSSSSLINQKLSQRNSCSLVNQRTSLMTATEQSSVVQPLLTDLYQISMAYAYWKSNKHQELATFDLYFRKNPFGGEYTLFAGLEECIKFIRDYQFHQTDIDYLRSVLPAYIEDEFLTYLLQIDMKDIKVFAVPEGTVVFPRIPLLRIEGPILKTQLLETTLLTLVNFASLVATNAARFRAAAPGKQLHEFGLRRAQGPDGGLSASRYCYLGGFDGTSNVLAGKLYGIPIKGTHAHAYVNSYQSMEELNEGKLADKISGELRPFADLCLQYLNELGEVLKILPGETNKGELAAFVSYAIAFPTIFLALVDTYDVLKSGLPNYLAVARALHECNYTAVGLRLDSGDLAYLSLEVRRHFREAAKHFNLPYFENFTIVASNDINEDTLVSLEKQGHAIDSFGIGTHLVTCQKQPALGCVYKLVELDGSPRIKVSQDSEKVTIPGRKNLYRLFGHDGKALCDLLTRIDDPVPQKSISILSRHAFIEQRRAYIIPTSVQSLYKLYWADGVVQEPLPSLEDIRKYVKDQIDHLRKDHLRDLNPTPYKVSVTDRLFQFMHDLWMKNIPIGELR